ncbi:MAG: HD domain-containing protein, partial [Armatimonadetes bacterium]|nr:HD domain-containing protein [Armatimonadota bacterium]
HQAQVFMDPEEDHFRTRLTHTLEVAQIARTIARALRLNEDLTEAIALAHDLGHSPFGHAGEEALDAAYRSFVPEAGFRHDVQSVRVVEVLEVHGDGPGLNLTWEVRDGIAHHSKGMRDLTDAAAPRSTTLEGQVVRIADRVAYVNHDLDDAVRAGVIRPDEIPDGPGARLGRTHSERIASMVVDIVAHSDGRPEIGMSPEVAEATDALKRFLWEWVYLRERDENADLVKAQRLVRDLFAFYMERPEEMPADYPPAPDEMRTRAQAVCDYIAGMTDRYAVSRFERHFIPRGLRKSED